MSKHYIAGPMTGYPAFNYPAFFEAAKHLREIHGLEIISPAEQDSEEKLTLILASPDGKLGSLPQVGTWGDFLSHDVKLIADEGIDGIIFLDGWQKSRGARLEAFVGLLCGLSFARYVPRNGIEEMSKLSVLTQVCRAMHEDLKS